MKIIVVYRKPDTNKKELIKNWKYLVKNDKKIGLSNSDRRYEY